MNGYYEDDLFLQQIDDNSEGGPALVEEDTDAKKALIKLVNQQNLKANRLIKALSDDCLELLVESLGLCQSSALAMVISNSCYPIELNVEDAGRRSLSPSQINQRDSIKACTTLPQLSEQNKTAIGAIIVVFLSSFL